MTELFVFRVDHNRYALPLAVVERVVRAAEVTPLPGAPTVVVGALNVHGDVFPVLDLRRRLRLPARELRPSDYFLIARAGSRSVVLIIDEPEGLVRPTPEDIEDSRQVVPGLDHFPGILRLEDGLALIYDLDRFLSQQEARGLDEALRHSTHA